MSSIIKGERIRSQSIINFSERFSAVRIEYDQEEITLEEEIDRQQEDLEEVATKVGTFEQQDLINEMKQEAEKLLEEARANAQMLLQEAMEQANEIKKNAEVEAGKILAQANEKQNQLLAEMQNQAELLLIKAEEEKQALLQSIEVEVVGIVSTLLTHLVGEELYATDWLSCVIKKMLQRTFTKDEIIIRVSPGVYGRLTEGEIQKIEALKDHVRLETTNELNDTSCEVKTTQGSICYDVQQGLEKVLRQMATLAKLGKESL